MTIPTYDALMLPVLRLCAQRVWAMRELIVATADAVGLTQDEREMLIPSGGETLISSRVHWAKTYLKQAGLVSQPKRGFVEIAPRGRDVLAANPDKIDAALLNTFEEYRAFTGRAKIGASSLDPGSAALAQPESASATPEEQILAASDSMNLSLRDALMARILEQSPPFFEKLIVDLLLAMGYGGAREDAGEQLGRSGDGGVDGIIREDRLGLDRVYLQAKKYKQDASIGPAIVREFIGSLDGKGATKGVLITTTNFTKEAILAAERSGQKRVVLIDGARLTDLMIEFKVGIRVAETIEIKRIDPEYFPGGEFE